jgi:2-keto-4-pentenoate hydratase/2-oxohepta-3-ene-1,7-dioic acid hydratase in catechol pathway
MRYVTVEHDGRERPGVLEDGTVLLLGATDLTEVIAGGDTSVVETVAFRPELLRAPLRRFRRDILCTGWNYWDHFEESRGKREGQDVDRPEHPTFFTKGPDTVIGPYDDIAWDPAISAKWDYEAEVALVIGRTGKNIPVEDALDHVWGYLLANDVSQRDLQRAHGGQWLKGKSIDGTMPLGPWIVTADEIGDPQDIHLQCLVNDEVRQDASTRQMAFDVATLISELSFGMTLRPGDLLLTGTPAGIGNAREPQVFLQDSDVVVTRSDKLGELRNRVTRR